MRDCDELSRAVIVGGGPSGLAAAIVLYRCGWRNIKVVEQRFCFEFEYSRSYTYSIDLRGQKYFERLGLLAQLRSKSVPYINFDTKLQIFHPSGVVEEIDFPLKPHNPLGRLAVRRHILIELLMEKIRLINDECSAPQQSTCESTPPMEVLNGVECKSLSTDNLVPLKVTCRNREGAMIELEADLFMACDGIHSVVRQSLEKRVQFSQVSSNVQSPNPLLSTEALKNINTAGSIKFATKYYPSESAGLKYKVLVLDREDFSIPIKNNQQVQNYVLRPQDFHSIRSVRNNNWSLFDTSKTLGILPIRPGETMKLQLNFIRLPNDELWEISKGQELKTYLQRIYPQVDWQEFIGDQEFERFAALEPARFPAPRHCHTMQVIFYSESSGPSKKSAVVLLGDSVHAFPPELGQGINASLMDVSYFYQALQEHPDNIEEALTAFEQQQLPEAEAICRLMQIADPQQYRQDPVRFHLRRVGTIVRLLCNKITPAIVSPPVFAMLLANDADVTYLDIWQRRMQSNRKIIVFGIVAMTASAIITKNMWWRTTRISVRGVCDMFVNILQYVQYK